MLEISNLVLGNLFNNALKTLEELGGTMMVTPLSLDGLDDDACNKFAGLVVAFKLLFNFS